MKKEVFIILMCLVVLLGLGLFSGEFTGQTTKNNIIASIFPQEEVRTSARHIEVLTTEKAECMYNLQGEKATGFRYYQVMEFSNGIRHTHLLKGLKSGEYTLNIKCTDENGLVYTDSVDLVVDIPEKCIPYCQYEGDCDRYAPNGCGGTCNRETEGKNCGGDMVCSKGSCVKEEKKELKEESEEKIEEKESPVIVRETTFFDKIVSFFKGFFLN